MSERRFTNFKNNLLAELTNKDWKTKAHFYKCDTFYDIFIKIYQYVPFPDFHQYNDEKERYKMLADDYFISDFENLTEEEINTLHIILEYTNKHDVAEISTNRGHAYMLFEDYYYRNRKNKNENPVVILSNSPTGREKHIPRIIINQITPKTFAILPLRSIKETEFDPGKFNFSFGIPCSISPSYSGIGDIFLFNTTGVEFSRINVIDIFNSNNSNTQLIGNTFSRNNLLSLEVRLFQEDSFIYSINVSEKAISSYLQERWSEFNGRVDLRTNKWLKIDGSTSSESFK